MSTSMGTFLTDSSFGLYVPILCGILFVVFTLGFPFTIILLGSIRKERLYVRNQGIGQVFLSCPLSPCLSIPVLPDGRPFASARKWAPCTTSCTRRPPSLPAS